MGRKSIGLQGQKKIKNDTSNLSKNFFNYYYHFKHRLHFSFAVLINFTQFCWQCSFWPKALLPHPRWIHQNFIKIINIPIKSRYNVNIKNKIN